MEQVSQFLNEHGYMAIFLLVFLQQIGIPNPATNELMLIFCGYLSYTGIFGFFQSAGSSIVADILGSSLIYFLFYSFSKWITEHSPRWIPLKGENIERMKNRMNKRGMVGIYIARYTPFIRGYVPVVAGMVGLDRKKMLTAIIITSITWNSGLVLLGYLLGPYWGA